MTNSSNSGFKGFPNIPSPPGSKAGISYARIIPAEELGECATWQPGAFGTPGGPKERRAQARPAQPAEPTPEQWHERMAEARKAGYQDGYRDGLVGLDNFKQAHAAQMASQLAQLVQAFERQWTALEPQMAQTLVQQGAGELLKSRGARLVPDDGVQRGGCVVQADIASVDASLETRWAQATAAMGSNLPLDEASAVAESAER